MKTSTSGNGKKRSQTPLPQGEALILMRSAIGYLLQAGFKVGARNGDGGLIITIAGAQVMYHNGAADFVPQSSVAQAGADVPQSGDVPQSSVARAGPLERG